MLLSLKSLGVTFFYQPLFNLLFGFVALLPGENLGLGIIALTVLIRILLLPSSAAAVKSQRELAALQPKIDEIRAKYKDKPEEMNQQLVAVYQEHKVNPFGSHSGGRRSQKNGTRPLLCSGTPLPLRQ